MTKKPNMQTPRLNSVASIAALACCGLFFIQAQAESMTGRVADIADGDSLTLQDAQHQQHAIRLAGIDAPELAQDFGQQAKSSLASLALNQPATAVCKQPAPNQPAVCTVNIGGKDIGLAQIGAGMAWWYQQNAMSLSVQAQSDYRQAEFNAKIHRLGFWNSKNPTPPWVWRRGRWDD
jgi:endonuclease YncB( thermonuclease family)